ncbi:hypothetical protein [Streptomyces virginiae]|uniref:hypothetical protein n=1 Tax=Streptomyces virginiae TaxID=1961 RepID=UPI0035D58B99
MPTSAPLVPTAATPVGLILRGWHWPLDVLASLLMCTPLLLGVAWADRHGRSGRVRKSRPDRSAQPPK